MTLKRSPKTRERRRSTSPVSNSGIEMLYVGAGSNAREQVAAEREVYLSSRQCVVNGCDKVVPCPHHGEPAEDRGEWLWSRRDSAA